MTDAAGHKVNPLDALPSEPGVFYPIGRGHMDFARLHRFTMCVYVLITMVRKPPGDS